MVGVPVSRACGCLLNAVEFRQPKLNNDLPSSSPKRRQDNHHYFHTGGTVPNVPLDNLHRLIAEIEGHAATEPACRARLEKPDPMALPMASRMPLCNSCGSVPFRDIVREESIFSRDELERRGVAFRGGGTERMLGTSDDVFTYVGPIRYQETSCGFFFKPEIETLFSGAIIATPFDSGGIAYLRPWDSPAERIALVRRHEMPVPEYRQYFRRCLELLFADPWHYVDGVGPDVGGPIPIEGGDARGWTFEVRFERRLPIEGTVLAVILPIALAASLASEPRTWEEPGVDVRYYKTPSPDEATSWQFLHNAGVSYLREWLQHV